MIPPSGPVCQRAIEAQMEEKKQQRQQEEGEGGGAGAESVSRAEKPPGETGQGGQTHRWGHIYIWCAYI